MRPPTSSPSFLARAGSRRHNLEHEVDVATVGAKIGCRDGAGGDGGGKSAKLATVTMLEMAEAMLEAAAGQNRRLPQATGRAATTPTGPTSSTTSARH
jgi:hypothetical protein